MENKLLNIEFKNGSSIKTIDSKDLPVRSKKKLYKVDMIKFFEEYFGIELLPCQKLLLRILEKNNKC